MLNLQGSLHAGHPDNQGLPDRFGTTVWFSRTGCTTKSRMADNWSHTILSLFVSVKKGLCPFLDSFITFDLSHWMVGKNLTQYNLCQTHMSSIYLTVKRTAILIYQCSKFIEDQLT